MGENKGRNEAIKGGREARAAKQWDTAVDQLQKASEMDANQHVVFANLADAYVGRAKGRTGADRDADIEKGIAAYQKAVELKPDDASYHNNYALALAQAKKFTEAQGELNKAAQLDPSQAGKFHYNPGPPLNHAGQTEPATGAVKKAHQSHTNHAPAYYQ